MERLFQYIGNHGLYSAGLAVAAALVLAFELRARRASFSAVSPQDAIRLMNGGALLLDLRPADAFAGGHLTGARSMNGEQILKAAETLKKHKDKVVIVYDENGTLGAAAVRQLAAQGFSKAFNLRGGISAWRGENLPLTRS
jgi:rhodanese-related sulfurtransferase